MWGYSLEVLDQLVEAEQGPHAHVGVVHLQVDGDLVHDARPLPGEVMLHNVAHAHAQLHTAQHTQASYERERKNYNTTHAL